MRNCCRLCETFAYHLDSLSTETRPPNRRVALLWQLASGEERVACAVYRVDGQLHMRVESASRVIVEEPFDMRPRALARVQALRASLKRRGWDEAPPP